MRGFTGSSDIEVYIRRFVKKHPCNLGGSSALVAPVTVECIFADMILGKPLKVSLDSGDDPSIPGKKGKSKVSISLPKAL